MTPAAATALARLPHGPEFRFIDTLENLEPGIRAAAEYRIPAEAEFLRGHFPGNPILPGVLMVEALAQLAGAIAQSDPAIPPLPDLRLTAIRNAKIFGTAGPGRRLQLEASIRGRLGHLVQAKGSIHCDGQLLLEAELTLAGSQTANPAPAA